MVREMVKGIVTFYKDASGHDVLGLGMPRAPNQASMTFNLEFILKHWFMGKNITIVVNDEEGKPSVDEEDVKILPEDKLAKELGVV